MEFLVMWESASEMLPLYALRMVELLHLGFAVTLACGLVGVIACLEVERRQS